MRITAFGGARKPGSVQLFAASRVRRYSRVLSRVAVISVVTTAGLLLFAGPALAHVTVTSNSAAAGSAAVLTFHVPNEEANADTTTVDMKIPTDHPIAQLLVEPVPGWTISVRTTALVKPLVTDDGRFSQVVSEVVWSGGRVAPGQFQDFTMSLDPLPDGAAQLIFKTIQTYSNGDVVRWIDVPQPGQPAPEHPAPVLAITASTGAAAPSPAAATASGSDGTARGIAAGGVVIGLLGLALGGLAWRRGGSTARREAAGPTDEQDLVAASAAGPGLQRNGTNRLAPSGPEPRRAGAAGRETHKRKGGNGRHGPTHR